MSVGLGPREVLVDWNTGSGLAFEGRVIRLKKQEGSIHFSCPTLKTHIETFVIQEPSFQADEEVPPVLNLSFITNARPSVVMDVVVSTLASALDPNGKRDVAHRWLFPEMDDCISIFPRGLGRLDNGLHAEQQFATSCSSKYQSHVPFLISGPPGTGKTRTVVETVHQILHTQPEAHILLCAPSNSATDTVALRLGSSLKLGDMLQLNDQNRTFAEVPDLIRQFCCNSDVDNDSFAIPTWKMLMSYKVVVTSCLDANILVDAACTNIVLCALEEHVVSSLHPHRKIKYRIVPHWTHLLIDEAGQGSGPELLVPISVVLPRHELSAPNRTTSFDYHWLSIVPQLILCGDINQLGPIITSQQARTYELDISLLKRLFNRPLYVEHTETRGFVHNDLSVSLSYVISKNYRSHPAILMPPSAMFYNDSLEACASNGMISRAGLYVDERATWFNIGEIDGIVGVISSLMSEAAKSISPLQADEIGVMAPWREQVWKIRERLRQAGLSRVDVELEKRVVIISCVRSSARFLTEDGQKEIGLVFEKERMNVAIIRAKELLVIIGNGNVLKYDPYWKGFLQFALRNALYVDPESALDDDGAWISRLESKTAEAEEEVGLATIDPTGMRATMMLAGGVVREILKDSF
ncbi:P-loop containing nucleoside triphosphate hydrolase protein [Lentinula edodes]|uniref:P-loop containing nucleoside triphosphate hydrolase protein n=1 Tax=Lentinula edodes TaxID=5353 RepID=UPI001E8D6901|nr:P-loop containing nucleoside triphosphate hydrolase protein [Lentinula edodes]KAH7877744.1 P-loop containing nucleoside triphosphate hydrolase protein [Lentinula edodes]